MSRLSWITAFILTIFLFACKEKKKQLLDNEPVEVSDFIEFFPEIKLPLQLADTSLMKRSPDSLRIGNKIFSQFIPDSVLRPFFGKTGKPLLYPIGRNEVEKNETYLFIKAVQGNKRAAYIAVFDDEKFVTAMPLLSVTGTPKQSDQTVANMDSRYTITILRQQTTSDGMVVYNKKVFVYNTEGVFTLILTESNDQTAASASIINPIDTLAATHKLSGDYRQNNKNFISVRDGRSPAHLLFFIHFEKNNGECKGELKGEAKMTGTSTARFNDNNGSCAIDFSFSGNTVRIKEVEGCGSYRDIKCFFEGAYTRKKKTPPAKKKKTGKS
ncbi:hypothetical protein [Flavihumibacter solisilvae]|uniref:Lipoprotein n=1 Tax=Flavihumibacter solisilvae TaxID=1349421 RepID=A0A0C1IRJ2_9BACT|nr:hypothetical protein [Flavihumibacter solisilvae]KIC93064.1 hypothetical protein OI18_19155 [Flavihumibacter solisilvae]